MIHMVAIFRFSKTKEKKNVPTCLKFYNRDDFDVKESSDGADLALRDCTDLALRDSTDSVDRDCARDCTDLALGDSTDSVDRDSANLVDRDSTFLNLVFNLFAPKTKISSDGAKVFSCDFFFGFFCGPNFTEICMEKGIQSVSFVETDLAYKSIMCSYKQWDTESALLQQDDTQLLLTNTAIASPPPPGNQLLLINDSIASSVASPTPPEAQLLLTNDSIASSPTPETQMLFTNSSSSIDQRKSVKRSNEDCTSSKQNISKKRRKCNPNNDGESFTPKFNDGENLIIGEESNLESLQIVDKQNYIGEEDGMINEEDEAKQSDGMVIKNNKDEGEEVIGQGCEGEFSSDSERKYKEDYYVSSSDSETKCK